VSKYTTELRNVLNSGYDIGLQQYPLFDDTYRETLNNKILGHYLYHEIGFETVEKFVNRLNIKMAEIMPYYNQLLESELLEANPLLTFERSRIEDRSQDTDKTQDTDRSQNELSENTASIQNDATTDVTANESMTNVSDQATDLNSSRMTDFEKNVDDKMVDSDTPTNLLLDGDITGDVYASKATVTDNTESGFDSENVVTDENVTKTDTQDKDNTSSTTNGSTTTSTTNTDKDTTETVGLNENVAMIENVVVTENGFEIPLSDLIMKYRKTFLNIDMLIVDELQELFMLVY